VHTSAKTSVRLKVVGRELTDAFAGPSFRPRRLGPEEELLDWFLSELPIKISAGCDVVAFREPRLASGFPDLVIVIWDGRRAERWRQERATLAPVDLQLAHYLYLIGPSTQQRLRRVFGRPMGGSIERLNAAGILRARGAKWLLRPLPTIFAAREIIAVEAKMSEWRGALMQAALNTWFASSSYVLVPDVPRRSSLLERAKKLGIGVWTKDFKAAQPTKTDQLPRSYASWLFNEWAWRAAK